MVSKVMEAMGLFLFWIDCGKIDLMKEALLYKKLKNKQTRCNVCNHHCVALPGKRGICGVRENRDGKLYSLVYGKAISGNVDPIEKKPFFHFLPGSYSLSIATVGCNFKCKSCQNWEISQGPKMANSKWQMANRLSLIANRKSQIANGQILGEDLSPEKIVQDALDNKVPSISYTYTEPTIFMEYALDTMKLAKKKGLKNNWVTNGFMSKETLKLISPYLDTANVDLKSFDDNFYREYCGGRVKPVLENLKMMKKLGIWIEVTTLVIPTLTDQEKMFKDIAEFIKNELGPETPWHISQFSGAISWKLQNLSETPVETLEKACQIGLDQGLRYVYSGNVPGLASEDTYCPKCKAKMIERNGYEIKTYYTKDGKCSKCNEDLNLILK